MTTFFHFYVWPKSHVVMIQCYPKIYSAYEVSTIVNFITDPTEWFYWLVMPLPRMQKCIHKKYDLCVTNINPWILTQRLQRLLIWHFSPFPYLVSFKSVFSNVRKVGSITHEGHIFRANKRFFYRNFLKAAKMIPDLRSFPDILRKNAWQINIFLMYDMFPLFVILHYYLQKFCASSDLLKIFK